MPVVLRLAASLNRALGSFCISTRWSVPFFFHGCLVFQTVAVLSFFTSRARLVDRRTPFRINVPASVPASACICATISAGWVLGGGIPGHAR